MTLDAYREPTLKSLIAEAFCIVKYFTLAKPK